MINLNVNNETDLLKSVLLGIANSNGPIPALEDCYDPNSLMHIKAGSYSEEDDMIKVVDFIDKAITNNEHEQSLSQIAADVKDFMNHRPLFLN